MSKEHLKPAFKGNPELAKEAGKKSGEARRDKANFRKTFRELYLEVLQMKAPEKLKENLKQFFPELPDNMSNDMAITLMLLVEASNGNLSAMKELREVTDGMVKQHMEFSGDITTEDKTLHIKFIEASKPEEDKE